VNPGNHCQSGSTTSRPRRSDFSDDVCALADAAKIHLRFKLAMGEVNKLGAYTNKTDWVWKVIQDTVKQKASNSILKSALETAQRDTVLKKNLTTYVSFSF